VTPRPHCDSTCARNSASTRPRYRHRSPLTAAVASLVSCALGGLIPLLPFLLGSNSLALALGIVAVALFLGGEAVGRVTGRRRFAAGLRQLALGTLAVSVAYGIGRIAGSVA